MLEDSIPSIVDSLLKPFLLTEDSMGNHQCAQLGEPTHQGYNIIPVENVEQIGRLKLVEHVEHDDGYQLCCSNFYYHLTPVHE